MIRKKITFLVILLSFSMILMAGTKITFHDPKGDDKGPGTYTYPTDPIYAHGSFDLTKAVITDKGKNVEFKIYFNAPVSFNWGDFWDVQQIQIYLDLAKGGHTKTLPGTQVAVDKNDAWDKVVFVDPHTISKINGEIGMKAKDLKNDIVLPSKIKPIGKSLKAIVKKSDLGVPDDADISKWGYGILMLSATGFPGNWCLLMRRVNEYEGQHRFGGGSDGAGDPNVIDMFVDNADGSKDEAKIQYDMLNKWKSGSDPEDMSKDKLAIIKLVYPGK